MKRLILAALITGAAIAFPASALADPPICHNGILSDDAGQGCADGLYAATFGVASAGSGICFDGILSDDVGQGCTNDGAYGTGAARQAAPTYHSTTGPSYPTRSSGGGLADVPGVPSSFAACVAFRESTNGQLSSNVYGIVGPGGQGSLAEQKAAFAQMYAQRGTEPWAPYDGC